MTRILTAILKWATLRAKRNGKTQNARILASLYGITTLLGAREVMHIIVENVKAHTKGVKHGN